MQNDHGLYQALLQKGGFELVRETAGAGQLRLIGRVDQNKFNFWLMVVHQLLVASARGNSSWRCDVSKQYLLGQDGVRHAWRLIFEVARKELPLDKVVPEIVEVVSKTRRPAVVELESQLLPGYRDGQERGGQRPNGKGASAMFTARTGPKAASVVRNGGQ